MRDDEEPTVEDLRAYCKAQAAEGAKVLHASATGADHPRAQRLTDAESVARARARLEKGDRS